jgi:hypothetical protein
MINPEDRTTTQKPPWPVVTTESIELEQSRIPGQRIKVMVAPGYTIYYDHLRRRAGDVFTLVPKWVTVVDHKTSRPILENGKPKMKLISAEEQFSNERMIRVEDDEPEHITTAQQALNRAQDELNEAKVPRKR